MARHRMLISLTVAFLLLTHIVIATEQEQDNNVLRIAGEAELAAVAKAHPFLAVEFYVPWCDHCKALAPEWTKSASELKKKNPNIVLATANGEEQPNFALNVKYELKAFPTIKIFQNGDIDHPFNYTGPRTAAEIVEYLEHHAEAAPRELETKNEIENFLQEKNAAKLPAVLAFLGSQPSHSAARTAFLHMVDQLVGEIAAAYVTDPSLIEETNCPPASKKENKNKNVDCDSPIAVMFKPNEPKHPRYQGEFTLNLLIQWAKSHATPLVSQYLKNDPEALQDFSRAFQVPLPQVIIAFEKTRNIDKAAYAAISAAAEANDDLKFTVTAQDQGEQLLKSLGVAIDAPAPLFLIYDVLKNEKYLETGMKLENLPEFLEEYKVGALTPFEGISGSRTAEVEKEKESNKSDDINKSHEEL